MTLLVPPSGSMLDADGHPRYGMFRGALPVVDLGDARVPGRPGPLGRLRLKQWEHWLVVHPELAVTLAVVDAAVTRLVWIQVIVRATGQRFEHRVEGPFVSASVGRALWNEHTAGGGSGVEVAIHNHLDEGAHRLRAEGSQEGLPKVTLALVAHGGPPAEALAVVLPLGRSRGMYSHKVPLPLSGEVRVGDEVYRFDPAECTAILDVHKAHYPRETWWNWATAVGFDGGGRRIAFNLTRNVVEGDALHENAAWIDGKLHLLSKAKFNLGADPWTAGTEDGAVDLRFEAEGERSEDVDYGVLKSMFRQRYGTFSGRLRVGGEGITLNRGFGLFEDHRSRW